MGVVLKSMSTDPLCPSCLNFFSSHLFIYYRCNENFLFTTYLLIYLLPELFSPLRSILSKLSDSLFLAPGLKLNTVISLDFNFTPN